MCFSLVPMVSIGWNGGVKNKSLRLNKPSMRAYVLLLFLLSQILPAGFAQKPKADRAYEQMSYHKAIEMYQADELDLESMRRIANSYRLNHDTQNAEKWYAQVIEASDEPLDLLHYAQVLQSNGNIDLARKYFLKYDQVSSPDTRGENHVQAIDRSLELAYPNQVEVINETTVNSEFLDFSPTFYKNGIVFASNRPDPHESGTDQWTGDGFAGLYFAEQNTDGSLQSPVEFSKGALATNFHEGPLTFTKNGDQCFFTRNGSKRSGKKSERRLSIFFAERKEGVWIAAEPVDLGQRANDAHPSLSANGQELYFASDRPGGYGGMDIYVTVFSGGKWGLPINLGPNVNTAGNEVFPFIFQDGTLYFASDGWGGLGGLDIFFCKNIDGIEMENATNLGAPFNSSMDDFGFVLAPSGQMGYFTSARSGGIGKDDIFRFSSFSLPTNLESTKYLTDIFIFDKASEQPLEAAKLTVLTENEDGSFSGFTPNEELQLWRSPGEEGFEIRRKLRDPFAPSEGFNETFHTDATGQVQLNLPKKKRYVFIAELAGYQRVVVEGLVELESESVNIPMYKLQSASDKVGGQQIKYRETLTPFYPPTLEGEFNDLTSEGVIIELENIYYDLGSAMLRLDAMQELDRVVKLMKRQPDILVELRSHTDSRGNDDANRNLSQNRARAVRNYIILQGIEPQRVTATGFGEDLLANHCDDGVDCPESAHQRNRRTEVRVFKKNK